MLEVKMIWSDTKNDVEVRRFEPDVEGEDVALVNNADSPYESLMAADVFVKVLNAVGYHPATIAKYMMSFAIDYLYDYAPKDAERVINEILKELEE